MSHEFNPKIDIAREELEHIIGTSVDPERKDFQRVVSLRDISKIHATTNIDEPLLESLMRNVVIKGTRVRPYRDCEITTGRITPHNLDAGQTFVVVEKLLGIIGPMGDLYEGQLFGGPAEMGLHIVYGITHKGEKAMAIYMPAIVEHHNGQKGTLLDGIHRSYLCERLGTIITTVNIQFPICALPFEPRPWNEIKMVTKKPPIEERYIGLNTDLFRDLTYVGIDG